MSCRTTPAGSAWTTFARLDSGLTDIQTLSTFHALRREGHDIDAPSREEWEQFVITEQGLMQDSDFSEARRRSLRTRMDRAASTVPDGPTWYALRNIRQRSMTEAKNVERQLRGFAGIMGESYEDVESRYQRYMGEVDRSRSATMPEGYEAARRTAGRVGVPIDHGTFAALRRISEEAMASSQNESEETPRRVQHIDFPESSAVVSAGYDPTDGRLEIIFRRRNRDGSAGTSRNYGYHDVPAAVWREMCGEEGPGHVYNRYVRNHNEYRYQSRDAEEAGAHRRCADCGQWWAPRHVCPTGSVEQETIPVPSFTDITAPDVSSPVISVEPETVEENNVNGEESSVVMHTYQADPNIPVRIIMPDIDEICEVLTTADPVLSLQNWNSLVSDSEDLTTSYMVSGPAEIIQIENQSESDDEYRVVFYNNVQCQCSQYQLRNYCRHIDLTQEHMQAALNHREVRSVDVVSPTVATVDSVLEARREHDEEPVMLGLRVTLDAFEEDKNGDWVSSGLPGERFSNRIEGIRALRLRSYNENINQILNRELGLLAANRFREEARPLLQRNNTSDMYVPLSGGRNLNAESCLLVEHRAHRDGVTEEQYQECHRLRGNTYGAIRCDECGRFANPRWHECPAVQVRTENSQSDNIERTSNTVEQTEEFVRLGNFESTSGQVTVSNNLVEATMFNPEEIISRLNNNPDSTVTNADWGVRVRDTEDSVTRFMVTGLATIGRENDGTNFVSLSSTACACDEYRERYTCVHIGQAQSGLEAILNNRVSILEEPSRSEPTPEPTTEPVPEFTPEPAPERPEPTDARNLGLYSRTRRVGRRGSMNRSYNDGFYDRVSLPPATAFRAAAGQQPVVSSFSYHGYRTYDYTGEVGAGSFNVNGSVVYDRPGRGQHNVEVRDLRCQCAQYRESYDCPHIRFVTEQVRAAVLPTPSGGRGSAESVDPAVAQRAAEQSLREDWMRNENFAREAQARHTALSDPQDSYTNNFDAFESDYDAALERKRNGEEPVPFMASNALNGEFTRESGRGFGVELEFDFPNSMSNSEQRAAKDAIGAELYELGLTSSSYQQRYHAAAGRGYVDTHAGNWSYESDCTVSGEIVSPIMYDEPETWENISKVCEVVKRHGGVANAKTGSHVHISAPRMTTATATELMNSANQHEDVLYRMSQNPERSSHRPMRWCGPNRDAPAGGYTSIYEVQMISSHGYGLNFGGVGGRDSDHPEIRYWDGSLSPSVIQAQVKMSAGLVQAAERNSTMGVSVRNRERVGSHHTRLAAVRGRSRRALTSDELRDDTATVRSFVDTLFTRREDKAQIASLFAVTSWQKPDR